MKQQTSNALRYGGRAVTGLVIAAAAAVAVVVVSTVPMPSVEAAPVAVEVETEQAAQRSLVCAGSFSELGADPARPSDAVPVGSADVAVIGETGEAEELGRLEDAGTPPAVVRGDSGDVFAAAQRQDVSTPGLRGASASICAEPVNEQWLVGGSTRTGVATTLSLGNPGELPATVQVTLFDENGEVAQGTTGVLVPAGAERTVSLNGYAPDRESIAARVVSTGASVTASLGVGEIETIRPVGVDTTARQLGPEAALVIPGVANTSDHNHDHGDAEGVDEFPVLVRLLAPGGEPGTASVRALTSEGESIDLGSLELVPGQVKDLRVQHWPEGAEAVAVESTVPVVGGALGSAHVGDDHDFAWFAPAPVLPEGTEVAAPIVAGGELVLVNAGDETATVRIARAGEGSAGDADEETLEPGVATVVRAPADALLTVEGSVAAGVRALADADLAGYPILPLAQRAVALTVYTR